MSRVRFVVAAIDRFVLVASDQAGEQADRDVLGDEFHRAIAERYVQSTRMERERLARPVDRRRRGADRRVNRVEDVENARAASDIDSAVWRYAVVQIGIDESRATF